MRASPSPRLLLCCVAAACAGLLSVRIAGAPPQAPSGARLPTTEVTPAALAAPKAPDFSRDVLPIIENNCLRCHSAAVQKGGLVLDTHEDVMLGGENGTVLTPGDAATSRLVQMIQAEIDPKMPPKSTLRPDEVATFKAWIDAGAKDSPETPLARLEARIPSMPAEVEARPAVHALAFSPDGRELAVPGYREVRRVAIGDGVPAAANRSAARHVAAVARGTAPAHGTASSTGTGAADGSAASRGAAPSRGSAQGTAAPLAGAIDLVRSVAYSRDGAWIAGAGGIPGAVGEVLVWNATTGTLAHTLKGHRDYVYQVVFNQRGTRLATCSYDKTIRIWDVETGRPTHVFREHTEAVYAVAFSPDDRWLASGAGDRSVKIWNLATGARLYTLTEPTDVVQTLAFLPAPIGATAPAPAIGATATKATDDEDEDEDGDEDDAKDGKQAGKQAGKRDAKGASSRPSPSFTLIAAGADKTIRTWTVTAQGGTQTLSIRGHNAPILRIAYSPDGKWLASSADDGTVKIWEAATGKEMRTLEAQPDWASALAWSPDGARLAVGRFDGIVSLYDAASGRRVSRFASTPGARRTESDATRRTAQP